uniref:CST complex subunit TEN1 n=2 Tax=Anthurium amnicola TaxID=1678845 RepID=A0A1D1Y2B0_9ARAE
MASPAIKPGVPITLQELEAPSELFKQGASLRITGKLESYCVESAVATIVDGSSRLKVDTQHLRNLSFRIGCLYQFIGELLIGQNNDAILQARIGRNVDGMDLNLYHQSVQLLRQFEAEIASARTA